MATAGCGPFGGDITARSNPLPLHVDPDLLLWLTLDGHVDDTSPHQRKTSLRATGDYTSDHSGVDTKALALNGGEIVSAPHDPALGMLDALTVCAWIRPEDASSNQKIVSSVSLGPYRNGRFVEANGYILGINEHLLYAEIYTDNHDLLMFQFPQLGEAHLPPDPPIQAQVWAHVCMTWQSEDGMSGYINGQPIGSIPGNGSTLQNNKEPITVGAASWGGARRQYTFSGAIDDVRVYRRALDPTEIQSLTKE